MLESGSVETAAEIADLRIGLKLSCGAAAKAVWLGEGFGIDHPLNSKFLASSTPSLDLFRRRPCYRQQFRYTLGIEQPGRRYDRSTCGPCGPQSEGPELSDESGRNPLSVF